MKFVNRRKGTTKIPNSLHNSKTLSNFEQYERAGNTKTKDTDGIRQIRCVVCFQRYFPQEYQRRSGKYRGRMGYLPQFFGGRALHLPAQNHADQLLHLRLRLLHQPGEQRHSAGHAFRDGLVELTMEFYRRNYIEGLFLSSGVVRNPDYTMERLVRVAKDLRLVHRFNGYIHLKSIPGASEELVQEAGLYADRLSVNLEIPTEKNLKLLAPEKDHQSVYLPMKYIQQGILTHQEDRKHYRHAPRFAPGGQSTQMIVGATPETDKDILRVSSSLYEQPTMKRVYYSGYISVNTYDKRLPTLKQPPLVRENRLYQADWLLRFYQFKVDEIVDEQTPNLDLDIDPKLAWALRHPEFFPVNIQTADYEAILRVPGIGVKSARLIVASRRFSRIGFYELKKMGAVMKKAKYFVTCNELPDKTIHELGAAGVRRLLLPTPRKKTDERQLSFDFAETEEAASTHK